ncbi:MAG: WYL domain-containing protein [Erysipelotrichaceae bacterium]
MNRVAKCIKMLEILNDGTIHKRSDLANDLEVNVRNIGEYKKELEACGYEIESTAGSTGGYKLLTINTIPPIKLNDDETYAIKNVFEFYDNNGTLANDVNYKNASKRVMQAVKGVNKSDIIKYNNNENGLSKKMLDFVSLCNKAMITNDVLVVKYRSASDNEFIEYKIHPYDIINFSEGTYLICYSLKKKPYGFRNLKFSDERMQSLSLCGNLKFNRDSNYKISNHTGDETIFKGKLKNYTIIFDSESYNRVINGQYEDEVKFIRYLLSFGKHVEVLEPQKLREQISMELKIASLKY